MTDERDYSEDELLSIYERVTDDFPYAYDADGEPLRLGRIFEEIVDVLISPDKQTANLRGGGLFIVKYID